MGDRVKRVRTEVSESQIKEAIVVAWKELFNSTPSSQQIALVLAQNSLETGNRKSMWNFNIGNITTSKNSPYNYFDDLTTDEQVSKGKWVKMNLKYRAYNSLSDGVKDYLRLLSGKHYSNAWQHILNPDPVQFSKALKQSGYYTADESRYTKTLSSLYNRYNSGKTNVTPEAHTQTTYQVNRKTNPKNNNMQTIENKLNNYLHMIFASKKRIYKSYLPSNDILIQVFAKDNNEAIEFSRILCTALDVELLADAYTHTDGNSVEVECKIHGPQNECFETVKELTNSIAESFKDATLKIGGIVINTNCIMNKLSSYQEINVKSADNNYRKFLLKFI